ncbi:carboxypeptidase-like regulatory domain-containing protein [Flavobacterium sp. RHBU_3]|uniref:carboxypeptidase-like regulatory domain-containing protein n=1 Tax=Flavobacterium sp. RHBU_3 TaxID=3391184 RepID=UPI0039847F4D
MLKKTLLLCCAALAVASCGLDYDGNTRNLYKGSVTDASGNPLEGIPVSVVMYNSSYSEKAAYTTTDANGNFRLTAARGRNGIPKVVINQANGAGIGTVPNVSSVTYHNINQETLNDYTLNLGNVALASSANNVQLTISSPSNSIKKLNLLGKVTNNSIDLDFPIYVSDDSEIYPYNSYYNDVNQIFYVNTNQTLTLRYMDTSENIHEQQITVGESNLTITIQ